MPLDALDWIIIAAFLLLSLGIGVALQKRASGGMADFFAGGRSLPWWIAGTSMVATTFAADTPLAVTGLVAKDGLAGNWFWWAWALGGMLTVFVFARLWRRAEVLTDVELIELRYSGPAARFLRVFRSAYVALIVNSVVIGWVTQAMCTVLKQTVLADAAPGGAMDLWLVSGMLLLTGVYSMLSGLWGVAITDMIQFVLAMIGCIVLAFVAVDHVGGIEALQEKVAANFAGGAQAFDYVPDFTLAQPFMPFGVFGVLVLCQWWATWYPGAEPGGGGYIVQRMASCKDEQHAVKATLWFQLAHYCLRPWPWIMVAFAAIAMYPNLAQEADPGAAYPRVIRDLAPSGLRGLLLVAFAAAYMSTISTQMNWGASYLVNDIYKRFMAPGADERKLVQVSRLASAVVLVCGGLVGWYFVTNKVTVDDAWKFLAALGAGVGSVFVLRWFWWRINAWSEIAAMVASLIVFLVVEFATRTGELPNGKIEYAFAGEYRNLIVASTTLVIWLVATFVTRPESASTLGRFFRKVRPAGPGWGPVAAACPDVHVERNLGRAILCALLGTAVIWLTLPGVGAVIFGQWSKAAACLGGAVVAGFAMLRLSRRLA